MIFFKIDRLVYFFAGLSIFFCFFNQQLDIDKHYVNIVDYISTFFVLCSVIFMKLTSLILRKEEINLNKSYNMGKKSYFKYINRISLKVFFIMFCFLIGLAFISVIPVYFGKTITTYIIGYMIICLSLFGLVKLLKLIIKGVS